MKILIASVCLAAAAADGLGGQLHTDVEYAVVDGVSLKLDVSVPDGEGPFPIAIYVHGGGWSGGDKALDQFPPAEPLTAAGFTVFSINYRLAPEHRWPACIDDVRTAIRWIKRHAAEYRSDPERITLVGYSAGGHLAAFAAVTADDTTRVQAVVLFAGPTDLEADCERRYGVSPSLQNLFDCGREITDDVRATLRETSPLNHLHRGLPPFLLIHGTADNSVPYDQSVVFQQRLDELGVPCELITIPGGQHNLATWETIVPGYRQQVADWLSRVQQRRKAAVRTQAVGSGRCCASTAAYDHMCRSRSSRTSVSRIGRYQGRQITAISRRMGRPQSER